MINNKCRLKWRRAIAESRKFLDELLVWRELSYSFCKYTKQVRPKPQTFHPIYSQPYTRVYYHYSSANAPGKCALNPKPYTLYTLNPTHVCITITLLQMHQAGAP